MDFSLEKDAGSFDFSSYLPILEKEVRSFGLNVTVREKEKRHDSAIRSAFLKGNTKEHLLLFCADPEIAERTASNEVIKIKLEVDTEPPKHATLEHKYRLLPTPYEVMLYDIPSLFAGKIHALLCRAWQKRIKGRDLYDYQFYLTMKASVNLRHLTARLVESKRLAPEAQCTLDDIKQMLCERFDEIDFSAAKDDVRPFIRNGSLLDLWSAEFFKQITENLAAQ